MIMENKDAKKDPDEYLNDLIGGPQPVSSGYSPTQQGDWKDDEADLFKEMENDEDEDENEEEEEDGNDADFFHRDG